MKQDRCKGAYHRTAENVQPKRYKSLTQAKKNNKTQSRAPKDTQRHKTNNKVGAKYPTYTLHFTQNHHQVIICKHNMPSTFLNIWLSSLMFCSQIFPYQIFWSYFFIYLVFVTTFLSACGSSLLFIVELWFFFLSEARLWIDWLLLSFSDSFTNVLYVKAYLC